MKSLFEHIWSKWWQLIGSRDSTIHLVAGVNELTNELFLLLIRHRSLTRICLFITRVLFERCMNYVIAFKWQELEESGHEPDIHNERHSQSQRLPLYKLSPLSKGLRFRLQTFAQLARWTRSSPGLWMACPRGMTITFSKRIKYPQLNSPLKERFIPWTREWKLGCDLLLWDRI